MDARASVVAAAVAAREVGANLELEGGVELRRVAFAYPHRPERLVLKEFNLVVPQGTSCALVSAVPDFCACEPGGCRGRRPKMA